MNFLSHTARFYRQNVGHLCLPSSVSIQPRRLLSVSQWKKYLTILDVNRDATAKDIKNSFLKLSKVYHPDNKITGSHTKFVELKEAYEALKDGQQPSMSSYEVNEQQRTNKKPFRPPKQGPTESVDMHHIYQVYKTLNRVEEPEVPRYRPFEDHNFPGTEFNRFEYSRFYDRDARAWVYMKKGNAAEYHKQMQEKAKILKICLAVIMIVTVASTLDRDLWNFSRQEPSKEEYCKTKKDIDEFLQWNTKT